jgi:outer membrane protein assembly factor BamB
MKLGQKVIPIGLGFVLAAGLGISVRSAIDGWEGRSIALAATPERFDALQFNFDARHSGNNTQEATITPANVGGLHRLFQVRLPAVADGAPALLSDVTTPTGTRDLLFVTTKAGHIAALDARTGEPLWVQQYPAGSCRINRGSTPCYTTSSPAVDPNRQYVYSYGLDGLVHRLRVGDGTEAAGGGWPELATLKPWDEKGSSALSIATAHNGTSYLYVAHGGYPGDRGDYQGHITAINLTDGSQRVFNANASDQAVHFAARPDMPDAAGVQSAIWARVGVVHDPDTDRIYMATGNGPYDPAQHNWGDTVFALNPDGTGLNGNPLDSYTPATYRSLDSTDADLGSTAPAILPVPAGSTVRHLAVQGGKDVLLRLINLDNMSGQGGPGHTGGEVGTPIRVPQGGQVLTAPAVWVSPADGATWVFVATFRNFGAGAGGISGCRLTVDGSGTPGLEFAWKKAGDGTSPVIANGILFYAGSRNVRALDPLTGAELWHDTQIGAIHWESPIVANGVLYITDESGALTAYAP